MQDTRLIHAVNGLDAAQAHAQTALEKISAMLDDGPGPAEDPHEAITLERAEKLTAAAIKMIVGARDAVRQAARAMTCHAHLDEGQCGLPLGHLEAHQAAECGTRSCIGSVCVKPKGHAGPHRGQHSPVEWTDESDRAYAASIARSMEGRRD